MRPAVVLLFIPLIAGAQEAPDFRTGVSLVHIDAEVVSRDGRILNGFTKDDFVVRDEGKPQPVVHLSESEEPLDLILLFDVSGSMRPNVEAVANAAREGMRELRTGDRVAIMAFSGHSRLVAPFREDLEAVQRSIQEDILSLKFGGATFVQTALCDAAARFQAARRTGRRRAILVITDNFGQRTRKEITVLRDLWEADALVSGLIVRDGAVHTINTISRITNPSYNLIAVGIKGITEKTGGDFIQAGDPGAGFQESMRRIRSRYTIYYAVPEGAAPGTRRKVQTELAKNAAARHPQVQIRARTGYMVPGGAH